MTLLAPRVDTAPEPPAAADPPVVVDRPVVAGRPAAPGPVAACPHCGTAVEGADAAFCCPGCAHAWEIIHGAGLDDYYRRREALPPRPDTGVEAWSTVPFERDADGLAHLALQVDGLRCAACVWVTERVLDGIEGVESAHVSYATGRTRLRWDPERVELARLAGTIAALGYRPRLVGEGERWDRGLLLRLGFAAFATMNIMLLSASIYAGWASSMDARFVALFTWTGLALATPVAFWAASPFFSGAWGSLRRGVLHMDLPIALAVAVLWGHAAIVTVAGGGDAYLDSLGMLVTLLLAGRVLEGHGRRRTADAALSLAATAPTEARRVEADGSVRPVATSELVPGDRVVVGPGQDLPADGVIVEGRGRIASALLTGESRARAVARGDEVWAGTVVEDGTFEVEVRAVGEGTVLHAMAERLRGAAERPVRTQFADRIAPWFTAATLVVAAVVGAAWAVTAGIDPAVRVVVAVLVVACPCALALAHPLVASAGIGAMARRGLLLRDPEVIDRLAEVDRLAIDKTGTLTAGAPELVDPDSVTLRIAAGLERGSIHPIARAVRAAAIDRGIALPRASEVREAPGVGVDGTVDGVRFRLRAAGGGDLRLDRLADDGAWIAVGTLRLEDRPREDSDRVVAEFRNLGLPIDVLTGDDFAPARRIGDALGVDRVHARMTPEEKTAWLEARSGEGSHPLFAGDGLNDGPALSAAHVGIAMGAGAASSVLAADGVVAADSLHPIAAGIRIARYTRAAVRRTQLRSIVYNVVAVSAAAAGWVNPLVAAILMPLSSGMVLASAAGVERAARRIDDARVGIPSGTGH